MTSTIIPPVDLAPGMPSRVVTISATDVTEGGKSLEGQMVRFALSDTLDVSSGGDVIAKTQAEVVLDAQGNGSIRLPVYDEDVRTWCGQDWAILVTATWGSQKAIRVPSGTSTIALSALPPVRPLRGREKQWAITGVSVSTTEGAQWDASVALRGGILDFDFTVPPGGTAWFLGVTAPGSDLNTMKTQGTTAVPAYTNTANRPTGAAGGWVTTTPNGGGYMGQTWVDHGGWLATRAETTAGGWTAWARDQWERPQVASGVDLGTVKTSGFRYVTASGGNPGKPDDATAGMLLTTRSIGSYTGQTWIDDMGWTARRLETTTGAYGPWRKGTGEQDAVAGSVDLDTVTDLGFRYVTAWGNNPNRPPDGVAGLLWTTRASGAYRSQTWIDDAGWLASRGQNTAGGWNAWRGGPSSGGGGAAFDAGVGNTIRLHEWLSTNPEVFTGGKGAVAFTFDHGLTNLKTKGIATAMSTRGFGFGLALNSSTLGSAENSGASVSDILSWTGAEIWNHGRTHTSAANDTEVRTEIVTGKTELETIFGREVWGYIPAGVGPGGLNGFGGGSTADEWSETLAGRLIMQQHAVVTGYMGTGGIRKLNGQVQQGITRMTVDTLTVARIKQQIDLAISDRCGVMFMLHPSRLDSAGFLTTAQFIEVLTYAKTQQDAGALAVLSPGELARADAGFSPAQLAAVMG